MIDLDALAAELRALRSDLSVQVDWMPIACLQVSSEGTGIKVFGTGVITMICRDPETDWSILDIIRRHVEPRPADDLRERARAAIASIHHRYGYDGILGDFGIAEVTDAVLAVMVGDPGAVGT